SKYGGREYLLEMYVASECRLIGKSIEEGGLRNLQGLFLVEIIRDGDSLTPVKPSDTIVAGDHPGEDFYKTWNSSREFYMITKVTDFPTVDRRKAVISISALTGMVLLAATGTMDIFKAAILAAIVLIFTRCITASGARKSIEWNILIIIASAFGISKALDKTGAASYIAGNLVGIFQQLGPKGVLAAVYLFTSLMTTVITNNAAAALAFPIALSASQQINVSPMPFWRF
ncbi:MAG: SLC13 family permease, partial [bacterium]